jgi:hypothetical protein
VDFNRVCLVAGSILAASDHVPVWRCLLVATLIVELYEQVDGLKRVA